MIEWIFRKLTQVPFAFNFSGSREERMAVFNAVRGTDRAHALYDFPAEGQEDVFFDLVEIDKIHFGQPFDLTVNIEVGFEKFWSRMQ